MGGSVRPVVTVWLCLVVAVLATACDSGVRTIKDVARVADEIATVAGSANDDAAGDEDSTSKPQPPPADVRQIITALDGLEVARRGSEIDYDRDDWRHWVDDDRDCQNTRAEVLIEESRAPVAFAGGEDCRVVAGEWLGPWSGEIFNEAGDVDIDHHVPLGHAHESGGWRWDDDRKRAFANDLTQPASLQVTKASLNRQKGKQPPDEWRPDDRRGWCGYAADWIVVKSRWDLTVTEAESTSLREMLETCGFDDSWGLAGQHPE